MAGPFHVEQATRMPVQRLIGGKQRPSASQRVGSLTGTLGLATGNAARRAQRELPAADAGTEFSATAPSPISSTSVVGGGATDRSADALFIVVVHGWLLPAVSPWRPASPARHRPPRPHGRLHRARRLGRCWHPCGCRCDVIVQNQPPVAIELMRYTRPMEVSLSWAI